MHPDQLTHQSHLQWHLDDGEGNVRPWASRKTDYEKFVMTLGQRDTSRDLGTWAQELDRALECLLEVHGTKLALFYSGGADSEVILRRLVDMGVKPEVHTIKFVGGYNDHETQHADELCDALSVKQISWNHDIERHVRALRYMDFGEDYQCSQLAYLTVLEHAARVQHLPVIMGGEVYVQKHQQPSAAVHSDPLWYYIYREDEDGCTYRYSAATGHPVINEVLTYTPELLAAYLTHPFVVEVMENKVPGKITLLSIKKKVYEEQLGIQLGAQTKFHGYERLQWTNLKVRDHLRSEMCTPQTKMWEYHDLVDHLLRKPRFTHV